MTVVSLAERDTKGKRGSRIGDVQVQSTISDGDVGPYGNRLDRTPQSGLSLSFEFLAFSRMVV